MVKSKGGGGNDRTVYHRKSDDVWVDKRNSADRGFTFDTQREAAQSAKEKVTNAGGGDVTIKGENGRIRSKDTYGKPDPVPPKDTEH